MIVCAKHGYERRGTTADVDHCPQCETDRARKMLIERGKETYELRKRIKELEDILAKMERDVIKYYEQAITAEANEEQSVLRGEVERSMPPEFNQYIEDNFEELLKGEGE